VTVADQIIAIAEHRGLPAREGASLTALIAALDADGDIPIAAFAVMAEMVSYLTRADAPKDETP